jgi:ubiquinone/menaquinone biosynthesis C-methylase UbiE
MVIARKSIPVNFDLSFLKIRHSNHVFIKKNNKIIGEGVVYGSDWLKAEKLAKEMTETKFGENQTYKGLPTCEQIFINQSVNLKLKSSNLKVKTGRCIFKDIKNLEKISQNFKNQIRIDANQGYSLKQLIYLLPILEKLGIKYLEEPVKKKNLSQAAELLHQQGFEIILDETLQTEADLNWAIKNKLIDVINIKVSRLGSIKESIHWVKLAKKHQLKVIIGCSEELERGMQAIYALGNEARRQGVLLEIEGFGPDRLPAKATQLRAGLANKYSAFLNRLENLLLILSHRLRQFLFEIYWNIGHYIILWTKKTKLLACLAIRLRSEKIHPKHLVSLRPWYLKFIKKNHRVLDIGCGNGQIALKISPHCHFVDAFDLNISKAKNLSINNAKFIEHSAEVKFPYPSKSFDIITFFGVLEHLNKREFALKECCRVLKPKGKLLLGVPNFYTSWKILQRQFNINSFTDPDHKVEYSQQQITQDLNQAGFKVDQILQVAYDTPWAGFIDLVGGFSLSLYQKLLSWKHQKASQFPSESNSFNIIAFKHE